MMGRRGIKTKVLLSLGLAKGLAGHAYYILSRGGDVGKAREKLREALKHLDEAIMMLSDAEVREGG